MRRGLYLAFGLLGATMTWPERHAVAQSFLGTGPLRSFVLPTEPRGELPVAAPLQPESAIAAEPPARVIPAEVLRPLPSNLHGMRFNGEHGEAEWPLYLTAPQARTRLRFQIAFVSAISVMPEGSSLTLSLNDRVIGAVRPQAAGTVVTTRFDLPEGLLKPGFNALRIVAEQRHRVDCSPEATYELWTALDPSRTGLVLPEPVSRQGYDTIADLAGLASAADGSLPIRVQVDGKLAPELMERALRAAQLIALSARHLRPVVEFGAADPDAQDGATLFIGPQATLQGVAELAAFAAAPGPRYGFLPASPGRAPTLAVTGTTLAEIDQALDAWEAVRMRDAGQPVGSQAGRATALRNGGLRASGEGERIAFRQAGLADTEFSGRLMRVGVDVAMPADFLPADYDRMTLNLAGSHSDGLAREASILVEVNGRSAATQMLGAGTAKSLERNRIFLPLSLMRPGQNRVEVIAQTATPADRECAPGRPRETRRLQILDRSELVLPRVARIGRSPELALLAAGGFPFAESAVRPVLFVPNPDRQTMAAAATFVAKLAVAAGRPLAFRFATAVPAADEADVLMVSPAPTLDPALIGKAGLDPEGLRLAWQAQTVPEQPVRTASFEEATGFCALPQIAASESSSPAADLGLRASLSALPFWDQAPQASTSDIVSPRTALLVAQDFPDKAARHLWTIVTAPSARALKAGIACLGSPQVWAKLGGRLAALRGDESVVAAPAGESLRYVATQPAGLGNLRLVAAGWLSLNPLNYVALAIALCLCLAGATLWLVLNSGRRQD